MNRRSRLSGMDTSQFLYVGDLEEVRVEQW